MVLFESSVRPHTAVTETQHASSFVPDQTWTGVIVPEQNYGDGDTTYRALGGEQGIRRLVDQFYDIMSTEAAYKKIFSWHPDQASSRDKLARFLCGWSGGPRLYQEKYGSISIPRVHQHLPITETERDQWIACMTEALDAMEYPEALRQYLIEQLSIPAELVRRVCSSTLS